MNPLLKAVLLGLAVCSAAAVMWFVPQELAYAGFMDCDWGLMLFTSTLAVAFLGICVHVLYRHRASRLLGLVGWFIPLSAFFFYVHNIGTYRASVLAIIITTLMLAGNGLGRAFAGRTSARPLLRLVTLVWLGFAFLVAKLCPRFLTDAPGLLGPGVGLLILGGAYLYYHRAKALLHWCMLALMLLILPLFSFVQYGFGYRVEDTVIAAFTPMLALFFGFAETRWEQEAGGSGSASAAE